MKKLKMSDLTPAMLEEVMKLPTAKDVVAFFAEKGFEVSEEAAQKIKDRLGKQMTALEDDLLDKVSGGACTEGGGSMS